MLADSAVSDEVKVGGDLGSDPLVPFLLGTVVAVQDREW